MAAALPLTFRPDPGLDRAVWRILSCAHAAGVEVSDAQLRAALITFSPDRLAHLDQARARVAATLDRDAPPGSPDEASTSLDEAIDSGILGVTREEWEQLCGSSI